MAKKAKVEPKIEVPYYPKYIETFLQIGDWELSRMKQHSEPSCFNSMVNFKKYKVTIEVIEEPIEVYKERLEKLWEESDNHHHYQPILGAAKAVGIELDREAYGKNRKKFLP